MGFKDWGLRVGVHTRCMCVCVCLLWYRNLRIREDTAKYLLNLDINSAYYDPKTRSMRENPNPEGKESEQFFVVRGWGWVGVGRARGSGSCRNRSYKYGGWQMGDVAFS